MTDVTLAAAQSAIRRRAQWRPVEVAFWCGMVLAYFIFPSHLPLITQMLISGLLAMSLDLLIGYGGIPSLGHAAFFGVGAYAAGLLANHGWGEPLTGLTAAALIAGLVGLGFSFIVAKVRGVAVLMVTMCICLLIYEGANRLPDLTGGDTGLQGMEVWPLFGYFDFDIFGRTAFWYAFAVSFALYVCARRYIASPEGLALEGLRENPRRVAALGISERRRKVIVFSISAAMAGAAGALLAQTTQIVALEALSFERSVAALIILIVGGVGTLIGGFLGAVAFEWARDTLSAMNPVYWMFWLGLLLIGMVLTAPGGLFALLRKFGARFRLGSDGA